MTDLIYPTLDLFSYTLIKGLGFTLDQIPVNYQQFWDKVPQHLQQSISKLDTIKHSDTQISFHGELENYQVDGTYKYWIIEDTKAFLFDHSATNPDVKELTNCLPKLKNLLPNLPLTELTLGQTWMISGLVNSSKDDELEQLAQKLYKDIFNQDGQPQRVGKLVRGTVFEVWNPTKLDENIHVLIMLYPDEQAMRDAGKLYQNWRDLLCYRHKIRYAYTYSRKLKEQLQADFNRVVPHWQNCSQSDLGELKLALDTNLQSLASYGMNLNLLAIQNPGLITNLGNYQNHLKRLEDKANKMAATDLNFLNEFSELAERQYQKQIAQDLASFTPGLDVLKGITDTIRGIVEIEQAQRDRQFQEIVGVAGMGIAAASLVASVSGEVPSEMKQYPPINTLISPFHLTDAGATSLVALSLSIILGGVSSFFTWIIIRIGYLRSRHPHSKK